MRTSNVRSALLSAAVIVPLVAACAPATQSSQHQLLSGPERLAQIRDSLDQAREVPDETERNASEPRVRIVAPPVLGMNRSVDAALRLSDNAYVFVVATDLDGRVRVVYPESPDQIGLVRAGLRFHLPQFFAGFGNSMVDRYTYSVRAFYTASARPRPLSGVILAVASDRPLQLDRLSRGNGEWDEGEIEQLIFGRGVQSAAYSLGSRLALTGQDFDTDYSGFIESAGTSIYSLAMIDGGCQADQTEPMNFYGPGFTRFVVRDGYRFAITTVGDPCSGYSERVIPIGPVPGLGPIRRDSAGAPATTDSSAAARAAAAGRRGRFADTRFGDVVGRARRSTPIGDESMRMRPSDRPIVEHGLRFRTPEQLRAEPRVRDGMRDQGERRPRPRAENAPRPETVDRSPPRPTPAFQEPTRMEPARAEPTRIEPSAPRPQPTESRKPTP